MRLNDIYNFTQKFKFSKDQESDRLLKNLLQIALSVLLAVVPKKVIKNVQITGSLATGEATVIKSGRKLIVSDFDFVVCLTLPYYFLAIIRRIFPTISDKITKILSNRNISTHICYTPTTSIMGVLSHFNKTSERTLIYDYEFTFNKYVLGEKKSIKKRAPSPTRLDAIQLVFTTIADYLFLDSLFDSYKEKVYWLAKRFLTLIYSVLIFEGVPSKSYVERARNAADSLNLKKMLPNGSLQLIKSFTEIKLTGSFDAIYEIFKTNDLKEIINVQKALLRNTIANFFYYQLFELYEKNFSKTSNLDRIFSYSDLLELLNFYLIKNKKSLLSLIKYVCLLTSISFLTRRTYLLKFLKSVISLKDSLRIIANYLISLVFLSEQGLKEANSILNQMLGKLRISAKEIKDFWKISNELGYLL